ncbi:MAG TPA: molybdopterin-dependent oxidoreductase [Silvibacterium sp.]|nr:molybdopterin-dependent oxidoreductase [Silvibacterium sp.]
MNPITRRRFIKAGVTAAVGASGVAAVDRIARRYGLIPPDAGTLYGPGETLTYATQRLFMRHTLAHEYSRSQISQPPFPNEIGKLSDEYKRMEQARFRDWRLNVDGLVAEPGSFSMAEIRSFPVRSQITMVACEEGWSYVAEWTGAPLSHLLKLVGAKPEARYVIYRSIQKEWWESIDVDEAKHPQTLLTYAMNDRDLPVASGGPLRLRVPRQLGYKSVKFITHLTVADKVPGLGGLASDVGYAWYAGI